MFFRSNLNVTRLALSIALGVFVCILVCAHGIPLLRHDWGWPQRSDALWPAWQSMFQPLLLRGLGETQAYPTTYLVGLSLWPLAFLPPAAFVSVFVALIVASVAGAGAAIARAVRAGLIAEFACAVFAVFNPWMYAELVAGHTFMVMSYGFLLWLTAEIVRPDQRRPWIILWSALLVSQIEFLAFAFIPMAIFTVRSRWYGALSAMCIASAPIAFGILLHYGSVRDTPYLLEWQIGQSVDIASGLTLRGYFADYTIPFNSVALFLWAISAVAAVATVEAIIRKRSPWAVLVVGFAALVTATGTKWVIAPLYRIAVLNFPETGVFRELYDLIAFVAIAYVIAIALASKTRRPLSFVLLASAAALVYPWIVQPPYTWYVPQRLVPSVPFAGSHRERVALYPDVQPLTIRGQGGSGLDPDLFDQMSRAVPINSSFPTYPQIEALAVAHAGDFSQLEALSVRFIISRPYLKQNTDVLRYQMIPPRERGMPHSRTLPDPYPMLGLIAGRSHLVSIGRFVTGNGIFYADAPTSVYGVLPGAWFKTIEVPRLGTNAQETWIDARLAYATYPVSATRFAGAFTLGNAPLPIPPRTPAVLAWTDGALHDDAGRVVAQAHALQWWPLREKTRFLRCDGACVVSGVGAPPALPPEAPIERPTPVPFEFIAPWLARASLPTHAETTLRWNVRYERSWRVLGARVLAHVRLDQDLNAWLLPAGSARTIYLVNVSAALQLVLEVLSFLAICLMIGRASRHA